MRRSEESPSTCVERGSAREEDTLVSAPWQMAVRHQLIVGTRLASGPRGRGVQPSQHNNAFPSSAVKIRPPMSCVLRNQVLVLPVIGDRFVSLDQVETGSARQTATHRIFAQRTPEEGFE